MKNGKAKTILIIDDDADFLEEIQDLLRERHYQVVTCSNSEQALIMVRDYSPAMIILDLAMPCLTGDDLLRILRKSHPDIPIVICTGVPNINPLPLLEDGALNVFQKPFSSEALFRTLDQAA